MKLTKQETWLVYKHTAPNGKAYFGITHQKPSYRWGRNGNGYKSNKHFFNAITKYGWENIKHEIITSASSQEEAEQIEKKLISEYKTSDRRYGYNKALGGHALSYESRRKIATTRKARGITSWTLGKHLSKQTREKISKAQKGKPGRPWTAEEKEKARARMVGENNPNFGKQMPEEKKRRLIERAEKAVIQVVDGRDVWYRSAKDASRKTGIAPCNITRVCKGQRATAGGSVWRYA